MLVDLVAALGGLASGDFVNAEGRVQAQGAVPQPGLRTWPRPQDVCRPQGPSCCVALSFRPQVKSREKADRRHELCIPASATKASGGTARAVGGAPGDPGREGPVPVRVDP